MKARVQGEKSVTRISVPTAALGNSLAEAIKYGTAIETSASLKKKTG